MYHQFAVCDAVWGCASAKQLWARKPNLVKSEWDRRLEPPQGDGQGAHAHTHSHTYIFFKFVSASLVSRFHMCLFPYSLSLGAVIEHGYFALTLHKLQHLPPDGQSFSFCVRVCSCVGPCWLPTLDVMYWTVLAATITLYVTSKDVSQLIPFQYGS